MRSSTRPQIGPIFEAAYRWSVAFILTITASLKLISLGGTTPIMAQADAVLGVSNRSVLLGAALIELAVAVFLILDCRTELRCYLTAWLASVFAVYRIALSWVAPANPCPCLGSLVERLPVSPDTLDLLLKLVIGYLLAGSIFLLVRKHVSRFS